MLLAAGNRRPTLVHDETLSRCPRVAGAETICASRRGIGPAPRERLAPAVLLVAANSDEATLLRTLLRDALPRLGWSTPR